MHEDLLAKLDEIEAEMKKIGFWPGAENHRPIWPVFDDWLQKTFLPIARAAILGNALPHENQFVFLAMLRRASLYPTTSEASHLLEMLLQFERLVESRASAHRR
jgi:uncharacterized protein YqcC (DUF446 family)